MPTPILPLLYALLDALSIPIHPQTLSSTSPSLLLLILETINGEKLALPRSLRRDLSRLDDSEGLDPEDEQAKEVEVVKCLLGTLDEQLSKDLTVVDPRRVVAGHHEELGVVIMALAVLARRRGISVRVPTPTYDTFDGEEEWSEEDSLVRPLQPDKSFSPRMKDDIFSRDEGRPKTALFQPAPDRTEVQRREESSVDELQGSPTTAASTAFQYDTPSSSELNAGATPSEFKGMDGLVGHGRSRRSLEAGNSLEQDDEYTLDPFDHAIYRHLSSPSQNASSSTSHSNRTVLDDIIEEFGLAPDP